MTEGETEKLKFKAKIYTLKKGTTLFSGPYQSSDNIIGHVEDEKGLTTYVFIDERLKRKSSTTGWIFFPTNHTVSLGQGREVEAWVAKMPGKQKGFVRM